MSVFSSFRMLTTVMVIGTLPMAAIAQSKDGGKPPAPDFSVMAQSLGVSESSLKSCMPAPKQDQRPEKPNASTIATCLKADNGAVTTSQVDDVLKKYGPKRP